MKSALPWASREVWYMLFLLLFPRHDFAASVQYEIKGSNGHVNHGEFDSSTIRLDSTSQIRMFVHAGCPSCTVTLKRILPNGREDLLADVLSTGSSLMYEFPRVETQEGDVLHLLAQVYAPEINSTHTEYASFLYGSHLENDEQSVAAQAPVGSTYQPWAVSDTVAYAVTRQSGNTGIAGAGLFFDLPWPKSWKWIDWARGGNLRWSFVAHFLPAEGSDATDAEGTGAAADIGLAPIGIGLFDNKLVVGLGWNISRNGQRPEKHNRYFYIGFSASQIFRASQ